MTDETMTDPEPTESEELTSRGLGFDQKCRVLALREAAHVLGGIRTPLNPAKIEPDALTQVAEYIMTGLPPTATPQWLPAETRTVQLSPSWRSVVWWSFLVFVAALALASIILGIVNWLA